MRIATALLFAALVASCGFSPMYAPGPGGGSGPIGPVQVSMIEGRAGHHLHAELERVLGLGAGDGPAQRLDITIVEYAIPLGLRLDGSASRGEFQLVAYYSLTRPNGHLVSGSQTSIVNYDIPGAAFGAIGAQDDARERAAEVLAQQIRSALALRIAQDNRNRERRRR